MTLWIALNPYGGLKPVKGYLWWMRVACLATTAKTKQMFKHLFSISP
jgi:hypothetical protein